MLLVFALCATAQQEADSVDVTDYDLTLDLSAGKPFRGTAVLTVKLLRPLEHMHLQLLGTVDSLLVNGTPMEDPTVAMIPVSGIAPDTPFTVTVYYRGSGYVENYNFGGFHFDNDMTYNLGVAFNEDPHVFGRSMFPCRDNFTDKATYTLRIKTRQGWTAECGGEKVSAEIDESGREHSVWRIEQETPTYLVSVSQANYHRINKTVAGYPLTLGYTTQDSAGVVAAFELLDTVVPMYERCFGPYRWGRIGYIATTQGSMEHVNNIALYKSFMDEITSRGQSTIVHELGHAWFGNLVTCRTEGDMWFNEGGASFCAEVAHEAVYSRQSATNYYQSYLEPVLRMAHITDGGYVALSGMPHSITYGSTTYDKGALVWHSLRSYLGDSLFYAAMRQLMADKAFGTVDAAEVRDSLSNYTGVDLTDFFDFHIFGKGFVDYELDWLYGELKINSQGVGTDELPRTNWVPVTYLSADGQTAKRYYTFTGSDTTIVPDDVPFPVAYCLLDSDCELSDAATRAEGTIRGTQQRNMDIAHFRMKGKEMQDTVMVYVDHHWGHAFGLDTVAGVVRTAGRYWTVTGDVDWESNIEGRFRYCRGLSYELSYPHLDNELFTKQASLDSIVLMHRYNSSEPWRCVSHRRSGNRDEGFYTCQLERGEYALAVVDTALVGINSCTDYGHTDLYPNPLPKGGELTISAPEGIYEVSIYDAGGRKVWRKKGVHAGNNVRPNLREGTYLVVIKNNSVSLQSKLIQL